MKLRSGATLRALMDQNRKSLADVGRYADCDRSFIWKLTRERKKTCTPEVAERISDLLNVPLDVLFDPITSVSGGRIDPQVRKATPRQSRKAVA